MRKLLSAALLLLATQTAAYAGGCYVCGSGSAAACRDYCQYDGADTFDNRHKCEARGCKIAGTTACPGGPQGGAKVCQAPAEKAPIIASTPWCAAPMT